MVRRGLSLPIHLYSVTVRVDKRLHIPVILLNNDPNNPRQAFVYPWSLFFFKAFVEHFYQSVTRDGSLAAIWPARKIRASHFGFHRHRLMP
jgi:hypothetical protein